MGVFLRYDLSVEFFVETMMTGNELKLLDVGKQCPKCGCIFKEEDYRAVGGGKNDYLIESWWGNFHYALYMQCSGHITTFQELGILKIMPVLNTSTIH